ncbi:hypothetical protein GCM10007904_12510 [Oharaeibacter diazotrophicus]|nr:hypothetical protein GCM10007904_12510 [Oharaeibacter diazotrophicus]
MHGVASRPPAEIGVAFYRATLFWPLALDLPPGTDATFWNSHRTARALDIGAEIEGEMAKLLAGGKWEHVPDTLDHVPPPCPTDPEAVRAHEKASYEEYTFFHDTVQHFLFNKQGFTLRATRRGEGEPVLEAVYAEGREATGRVEPFYLLRRTDIATATFELADEYDVTSTDETGHVRKKTVEKIRVFAAKVDRLNLYVFRSGLAILALELSGDGKEPLTERDEAGFAAARALTLADAMDLGDRLRRAHAPYIDIRENHPDRVPLAIAPREVTYVDGNGETLLRWRPDTDLRDPDGSRAPTGARVPLRRKLREMPDGERKVPPFRHWSFLLGDESFRRGDGGRLAWKIAPARAQGLTWRHFSDDRLPLLATIELADPADHHLERGLRPPCIKEPPWP